MVLNWLRVLHGNRSTPLERWRKPTRPKFTPSISPVFDLSNFLLPPTPPTHAHTSYLSYILLFCHCGGSAISFNKIPEICRSRGSTAGTETAGSSGRRTTPPSLFLKHSLSLSLYLPLFLKLFLSLSLFFFSAFCPIILPYAACCHDDHVSTFVTPVNVRKSCISPVLAHHNTFPCWRTITHFHFHLKPIVFNQIREKKKFTRKQFRIIVLFCISQIVSSCSLHDCAS